MSFLTPRAIRPYTQRVPTDYLEHMDPAIRAQLSPTQLQEVERLLQLALPQPAPKLVDLRFDIDLVVDRFFIVLFVGKDRRKHSRPYITTRLTRFTNTLAAIALLIGFNLTVSLGLGLCLYLIKSALAIDLFPGHLTDIFD